MIVEDLRIYIDQINVDDILEPTEVSEAVVESVRRAVIGQLTEEATRFTREAVAEVKADFRERLQAEVGPRLDKIFEAAIEEIGDMTDDQLVKEALDI